MKTIRREIRDLDLPQLLRQGEGRIVLLTDGGEELYALVPADEKMRPRDLIDAERRARDRLDDSLDTDSRDVASARQELLPLARERLTLRTVLEIAENETAVFLTEDGRIQFALLPLLESAGRRGVTGAPRRRESAPRFEPRHDWPREGRSSRDRREDDGLSSSEWVLYPLLFLFVPAVNVMVSSVLYYVWRSDSPRKALQINLLGFAVFGVHVLLSVLFFVVVPAILSGGGGPPQQVANPPNQGMNPPPKPPPDRPGPLAYWSFDEGQGDRAANTGSSGAPFATLHGVRWTEGVRGKAVEFDGTSAYCDLGNAPELNFGKRQVFTVSLWVKTDDDFGTIFLMRNKDDGGAVITLVVENGQLAGLVREDGSEALAGSRSQGKQINDGRWHHVCLCRDVRGIQTRVIQDDEHLGIQNGRQVGGTGPITTNLRALGTERYWAARNQGTPERRSLRGSIDEVCVYNRLLNGAEIKTLRDAGPPPGSR